MKQEKIFTLWLPKALKKLIKATAKRLNTPMSELLRIGIILVSKIKTPMETKCPNCQKIVTPIFTASGEYYSEECPKCGTIINED